MRGHQLVDARSLAVHGAVARRIGEDPGVVARTHALLDRCEREGAIHRETRAAWRAVLALPAVELAARLTDQSEHMAHLRQSSRFAGALTPRERWAVLRGSGREPDAVT